MPITNRQKQNLLKEDEKIFLYKKGSRGQIVGVYDCIRDIVDLERPFNILFDFHYVGRVLGGARRTFSSFYHGCRVKAVIKKVA